MSNCYKMSFIKLFVACLFPSQTKITRDMEHGEEIDHADIVAPFACRRLDIPEPLHIFASQGTRLIIMPYDMPSVRTSLLPVSTMMPIESPTS